MPPRKFRIFKGLEQLSKQCSSYILTNTFVKSYLLFILTSFQYVTDEVMNPPPKSNQANKFYQIKQYSAGFWQTRFNNRIKPCTTSRFTVFHRGAVVHHMQRGIISMCVWGNRHIVIAQIHDWCGLIEYFKTKLKKKIHHDSEWKLSQ